MRALAVICFVAALAFAGRADARRVVHIPTLEEVCPGNDDWAKVGECIKRHGAFTVVREEANLKVVSLGEQSRFAGIYIYMHGKTWRMHGQLRISEPHDVLDFSHVTFGNHVGVRLDVGLTTPMSFSIDGETSETMGLFRQTLTLLCFEDGVGCTQMTTACDLMLHGKAYYSFRGKLRYANHQLEVIGDRRIAGDYCAQPELVLSD
ncbi:MAG TPA: hypothetical protein VIV40_41085 [Kofleriaceae bacterium]